MKSVFHFVPYSVFSLNGEGKLGPGPKKGARLFIFFAIVTLKCE